jgi:hypothetical protein
MENKEKGTWMRRIALIPGILLLFEFFVMFLYLSTSMIELLASTMITLFPSIFLLYFGCGVDKDKKNWKPFLIIAFATLVAFYLFFYVLV